MSRIVVSADSYIPPPILCESLIPVQEDYRNPWFKVMNRGGYYTLEYDRPQVVILPIVENDSILMVRVKRPIINDSTLELPAGDSNEGETPQTGARREFAEETGIFIEDIARFKAVKPISEMPGRMPVLLSIFQIDLTLSEYSSRNAFDEEITAVELFSRQDIINKIISGEIYLSSPIAILARYILENTKVESSL